MIKGWDEGIVGLPVGSEALLTIPPAAGYGNKKSGKIPANSTLKFGRSTYFQRRASYIDVLSEVKVLGAS